MNTTLRIVVLVVGLVGVSASRADRGDCTVWFEGGQECVYGPDIDGDTVVLTRDDCTLNIKAPPTKLRHGTLTKDGRVYAGCWALAIDGVRIVWEPLAPYKGGWRMNTNLFREML